MNNMRKQSLVNKTVSANVVDIDNYTGTFEALLKIKDERILYTCRLYSDCNDVESRAGMKYIHSIILNKYIMLECMEFDEYGRLLVKIV